MKRVYHHYKNLEEYKNGMWRILPIEERENHLTKVIEFMRDTTLFGRYMLRVIKEWPVSCEHNLTITGSNRRSWLGQAACCFAIGCPEDVVRTAWSYLTREQQDKANMKASRAINLWEKQYNAKN